MSFRTELKKELNENDIKTRVIFLSRVWLLKTHLLYFYAFFFYIVICFCLKRDLYMLLFCLYVFTAFYIGCFMMFIYCVRGQFCSF